ncbi:MAG: CoA-transferase subunit beta, partial [Acidobacteriota bacterium]|nr:CoA-transferase subunit beta [Acidobacteriota bacterium]
TTRNEMMVCQAARQLVDGETVFVGIGLPNLACNLARRLHAPSLVLIYESGTIGSAPRRVPVSIGDPALVEGALGVCSMADVFSNYLQAGRVGVGFLQGSQIDRFGNLNTTVIGDYARPAVRLPGSGGACEIALHARRVLIVARQSRRAFPERLDFLTSAGFLGGGGERRRLGMPGGGPAMVITDLACFEFEEEEMTLKSLHPGVTEEQVRENLGWAPRVAPRLAVTEPPSAEELRLLREELDPKRLYR